MITRGIRDYMDRDWSAVRKAKDAYWAERIARLGAAEALRIADELRRQALVHDAEWPRPSDRLRDLNSHVRLAALLRRGCPTRRA